MDTTREPREVVEERFTRRLMESKYGHFSLAHLRMIAHEKGIVTGNRDLDELAFACAWHEANMWIERWQKEAIAETARARAGGLLL